MFNLFRVSLLVCSRLPTKRCGNICEGNESPVGLSAFGGEQVSTEARLAGLSCR